MRAPDFAVTREDVAAGVSVLKPAEELDLASVPRLEAAVSEALRAGSAHLVLDLSHLAFVDSSGLRLFLLLCRRSQSEGWQLTLTRPSAPVNTLFEITGAGKTLPIVPDWELP